MNNINRKLLMQKNKKQNGGMMNRKNLLDMEKNYLKKRFPLKEKYESIIPLKLYQTWPTKNLTGKVLTNYEYMKYINPEFEFILHDDEESRNYIKDNFEPEVLEAYDSFIPGAYKADLWRYCILYKNGGIYLDMKYHCVNNFKLIALTEREHFATDWNKDIVGNKMVCRAIYNAIIAVMPGNDKLKKCIDRIVYNAKNRLYGKNPLHVTGPKMMIEFFNPDDIKKNKLNLYMRFDDCIRYELYPVLRYFKEYRKEQKTVNIKHYDKLWRDHNIYVDMKKMD